MVVSRSFGFALVVALVGPTTVSTTSFQSFQDVFLVSAVSFSRRVSPVPSTRKTPFLAEDMSEIWHFKDFKEATSGPKTKPKMGSKTGAKTGPAGKAAAVEGKSAPAGKASAGSKASPKTAPVKGVDGITHADGADAGDTPGVKPAARKDGTAAAHEGSGGAKKPPEPEKIPVWVIVIAVVIPSVLVLAIGGVLAYICWKRKQQQIEEENQGRAGNNQDRTIIGAVRGTRTRGEEQSAYGSMQRAKNSVLPDTSTKTHNMNTSALSPNIRRESNGKKNAKSNGKKSSKSLTKKSSPESLEKTTPLPKESQGVEPLCAEEIMCGSESEIHTVVKSQKSIPIIGGESEIHIGEQKPFCMMSLQELSIHTQLKVTFLQKFTEDEKEWLNREEIRDLKHRDLLNALRKYRSEKKAASKKKTETKNDESKNAETAGPEGEKAGRIPASRNVLYNPIGYTSGGGSSSSSSKPEEASGDEIYLSPLQAVMGMDDALMKNLNEGGLVFTGTVPESGTAGKSGTSFTTPTQLKSASASTSVCSLQKTDSLTGAEELEGTSSIESGLTQSGTVRAFADAWPPPAHYEDEDVDDDCWLYGLDAEFNGPADPLVMVKGITQPPHLKSILKVKLTLVTPTTSTDSEEFDDGGGDAEPNHNGMTLEGLCSSLLPMEHIEDAIEDVESPNTNSAVTSEQLLQTRLTPNSPQSDQESFVTSEEVQGDSEVHSGTNELVLGSVSTRSSESEMNGNSKNGDIISAEMVSTSMESMGDSPRSDGGNSPQIDRGSGGPSNSKVSDGGSRNDVESETTTPSKSIMSSTGTPASGADKLIADKSNADKSKKRKKLATLQPSIVTNEDRYKLAQLLFNKHGGGSWDRNKENNSNFDEEFLELNKPNKLMCKRRGPDPSLFNSELKRLSIHSVSIYENIPSEMCGVPFRSTGTKDNDENDVTNSMGSSRFSGIISSSWSSGRIGTFNINRRSDASNSLGNSLIDEYGNLIDYDGKTPLWDDYIRYNQDGTYNQGGSYNHEDSTFMRSNISEELPADLPQSRRAIVGDFLRIQMDSDQESVRESDEEQRGDNQAENENGNSQEGSHFETLNLVEGRREAERECQRECRYDRHNELNETVSETVQNQDILKSKRHAVDEDILDDVGGEMCGQEMGGHCGLDDILDDCDDCCLDDEDDDGDLDALDEHHNEDHLGNPSQCKDDVDNFDQPVLDQTVLDQINVVSESHCHEMACWSDMASPSSCGSPGMPRGSPETYAEANSNPRGTPIVSPLKVNSLPLFNGHSGKSSPLRKRFSSGNGIPTAPPLLLEKTLSPLEKVISAADMRTISTMKSTSEKGKSPMSSKSPMNSPLLDGAMLMSNKSPMSSPIMDAMGSPNGICSPRMDRARTPLGYKGVSPRMAGVEKAINSLRVNSLIHSAQSPSKKGIDSKKGIETSKGLANSHLSNSPSKKSPSENHTSWVIGTYHPNVTGSYPYDNERKASSDMGKPSSDSTADGSPRFHDSDGSPRPDSPLNQSNESINQSPQGRLPQGQSNSQGQGRSPVAHHPQGRSPVAHHPQGRSSVIQEGAYDGDNRSAVLNEDSELTRLREEMENGIQRETKHERGLPAESGLQHEKENPIPNEGHGSIFGAAPPYNSACPAHYNNDHEQRCPPYSNGVRVSPLYSTGSSPYGDGLMGIIESRSPEGVQQPSHAGIQFDNPFPNMQKHNREYMTSEKSISNKPRPEMKLNFKNGVRVNCDGGFGNGNNGFFSGKRNSGNDRVGNLDYSGLGQLGFYYQEPGAPPWNSVQNPYRVDQFFTLSHMAECMAKIGEEFDVTSNRKVQFSGVESYSIKEEEYRGPVKKTYPGRNRLWQRGVVQDSSDEDDDETDWQNPNSIQNINSTRARDAQIAKELSAVFSQESVGRDTNSLGGVYSNTNKAEYVGEASVHSNDATGNGTHTYTSSSDCIVVGGNSSGESSSADGHGLDQIDGDMNAPETDPIKNLPLVRSDSDLDTCTLGFGGIGEA